MRLSAAILLTVCMAAMWAGDAYARRQRTTRGNVSGRAVRAQQAVALPDSAIIPDSAAVLLFGYDKPLRSRRETVFVTNRTDFDINAVSVTTQYLDSKGRQFHETTRRVRADIPAGSTRKLDWPSWDTQQSFYYVGSKRSRVSGTPYQVRQSVDTIFVSRTVERTH